MVGLIYCWIVRLQNHQLVELPFWQIVKYQMAWLIDCWNVRLSDYFFNISICRLTWLAQCRSGRTWPLWTMDPTSTWEISAFLSDMFPHLANWQVGCRDICHYSWHNIREATWHWNLKRSNMILRFEEKQDGFQNLRGIICNMTWH